MSNCNSAPDTVYNQSSNSINAESILAVFIRTNMSNCSMIFFVLQVDVPELNLFVCMDAQVCLCLCVCVSERETEFTCCRAWLEDGQ